MNPVPAFEVRPASAGDAPALVRFNQAMAAETEDKSLDGDVLAAGVAGVPNGSL